MSLPNTSPNESSSEVWLPSPDFSSSLTLTWLLPRASVVVMSTSAFDALGQDDEVVASADVDVLAA